MTKPGWYSSVSGVSTVNNLWDPENATKNTLTHPYTTVACAAGVVTGTAGRDTARAIAISEIEGHARKPAGLRMWLS